MQPSIQEDTWTAPIVYFFYIIIADLLPTTSQLVSMFVVVEKVNESVNNSIADKSDIISHSFQLEDKYSYMDADGEREIQFSTGARNTSSQHYRELTSKFLENMSNSNDA